MSPSYFSDDIQEFLSFLAKHEVKYVIVGGEAVIFYGHARLTGDIDLLYEASDDNVDRLYQALMEFWEGNIPGIETEEDLKERGLILQFGVPPNRIDLINQIEGVSFEEVWNNKTEVQIAIKGEKLPLYYIGLDQLIKNKESLKRYKDLEDLKFLKEVSAKRKKPGK